MRERLDDPPDDLQLLESDFRHIESVNRWLGGWRAAFTGIAPWLTTHRPARILDVGCGSADVPRAIIRQAARRGLRLHFVAVDRSPAILEVARRRSGAQPHLQLALADAFSLPFDDASFDIAIISMALHHFDHADRIRVLRELGRVATQRVIINDLERCWPNYAGARLLAATVWRRHTMARHDGPLSVLRAFTRNELKAELREAGLRDVQVRRRWFHRLVASAAPARADATRAARSTVA